MRLPDWSTRLQAAVAERLQRPFAWGAMDCALFAADCVAACTGADPAADFRGRYRSEFGARRLIARAVGGGGLGALAAARLGSEIPPGLALRGDVGLSDQGEGMPLLVVCNGPQWLGPGPSGVVIAPAPLRAWRV